jgi:hypothetical protein
VSPYTVARELGHGSTAMVEKVYSHLGTLRQRSEMLEYRVERRAATLEDRLDFLRGADLLPKCYPRRRRGSTLNERPCEGGCGASS